MLSQPITDYIQKFNTLRAESFSEGTLKIHVDEIAARLALFYERVRSIIDYQEEHLLRKQTIDRIFRRRFFMPLGHGSIAEAIIKDIIRAGHLKNDSIPEAKIGEVQNIIDHFKFLLEHVAAPGYSGKEEVVEWLTIIVTNAIEEALFSPMRDLALAELMFFALKEKLTINGVEISESDMNMQLYIAVQRALLRVDDEQLQYRLFQSVYPNWTKCETEECLKIAGDVWGIKEKVARQLKHPLAGQFFSLCNRYNTIFYIVGDLSEAAPMPEAFVATLDNPQTLEDAVKDAYQKRYAREKGRLNRLAFFSVISFLLSKIAIAIGIEAPLDIYVTHNFSWLSSVINLVFPPLLIFAITQSIKMPSVKNFHLVLEGIQNVVIAERPHSYSIKVRGKKKFWSQAFIKLIYAGTVVATFYALFEILTVLNFSIANMVVFALFTSLVAATGVKVHKRAQELSLEEEKATMRSFILDLIAMPFVTIGRWAIAGLARFNILVIAANLIIELPFQFFIEFIENFRNFIKGQKEEIR